MVSFEIMNGLSTSVQTVSCLISPSIYVAFTGGRIVNVLSSIKVSVKINKIMCTFNFFLMGILPY